MAVSRPRTSRRQLNLWPIGLLSAAIAALGLWADRPFIDLDVDHIRNVLPIEYVRVEGAVWYLEPSDLELAVMPHLQAGFFALDLKAIEAAVGSLPWIDYAEASRIWPDTVVVHVVEQTPVARWGTDGLLNFQGVSFIPPNVGEFARLPLLAGPSGRELEMLGMLRALNGKLRARNLQIASLRLSPRLAWEARTENGMEIVFGSQDPLAATDRLLTLLPQLGEGRVATIKKLDLRYPNGFSVVWKPELPIPPDQLG